MSQGIWMVSDHHHRISHSGEDVPQHWYRLPPSNGASAGYPKAFSQTRLPTPVVMPWPPRYPTMWYPKFTPMMATPMSSAKSELLVHAVRLHSWVAVQVPYGRGFHHRSSSYAGTNCQFVAQT